MNVAQEFFTWSSLGTLAAASAAVVVVTNTVRKVIGLATPLVPFIVSLLITIGGAYQTDALHGVGAWGIAFLNACLLFCTATGAQEVVVEAATPRQPEEAKPHAGRRLKWLSSWMR
jgi:hypothetical protein